MPGKKKCSACYECERVERVPGHQGPRSHQLALGLLYLAAVLLFPPPRYMWDPAVPAPASLPLVFRPFAPKLWRDPPPPLTTVTSFWGCPPPPRGV